METRANYVLIGSFALAGFLGLLGFLLWFAQFELNRQFAYYDVRFTSVAGLSRASEVRFAGLAVGQVVDVRLAPNGDGTVVARLEVVGDTPVRTDSVATIESMGVTGVSYVGITSGDPSSPLLRTEGGIPEITAGRSVLQSLSEDAPQIVAQTLSVMQNINDLLDDRNRQQVQAILDNLAMSSESLNAALADFSDVSSTIANASTEIAAFTAQVGPVLDSAQRTMGNIDTALSSVTVLSERAVGTLDQSDAALASGRVVLDAAGGFMTDTLPLVVQDLTETTALLRMQTEAVAGDARGMIGSFTATGDAAAARLAEAEGILRNADAAIARLVAAMDNVDAAATSFDTLIAEDGTALIDETRAMIANANDAAAAVARVAVDDLPVIVADLRGAAETVAQVMTEMGQDVSDAADEFTTDVESLTVDASETIAVATSTFANANATLAAINGAMAVAERGLAAATRAFDGADRVINEDIGVITADLRGVLGELNGAIAQVSDDIPAITADLRRAAATAETTLAQLGGMVSDASAPVQAFATAGLPQYTRLAREMRGLITNLDGLVRRLERDPARFFLDRQTPEFRR